MNRSNDWTQKCTAYIVAPKWQRYDNTHESKSRQKVPSDMGGPRPKTLKNVAPAESYRSWARCDKRKQTDSSKSTSSVKASLRESDVQKWLIFTERSVLMQLSQFFFWELWPVSRDKQKLLSSWELRNKVCKRMPGTYCGSYWQNHMIFHRQNHLVAEMYTVSTKCMSQISICLPLYGKFILYRKNDSPGRTFPFMNK